MPVSTVEEVIQKLDEIIADAVKNSSPEGYLPALYRQVTLKLDGLTKDELSKKEGTFSDNARMRTMIVTFAGRYIDAYELWKASKETTKSWHVPFSVIHAGNKLVIQHLVLAINAHINLDLGIASATVAPGDKLAGFKHDFDAINKVLFDLIDTMEARLNRISPWVGLIDRLLKQKDHLFIEWSLHKARDAAWTFANKLAALPENDWTGAVNLRDTETAFLGKLMAHPGVWANIIIWIVRRWESKDVARNILILEGDEEPVKGAAAAAKIAARVASKK